MELKLKWKLFEIIEPCKAEVGNCTAKDWRWIDDFTLSSMNIFSSLCARFEWWTWQNERCYGAKRIAAAAHNAHTRIAQKIYLRRCFFIYIAFSNEKPTIKRAQTLLMAFCAKSYSCHSLPFRCMWKCLVLGTRNAGKIIMIKVLPNQTEYLK